MQSGATPSARRGCPSPMVIEAGGGGGGESRLASLSSEDGFSKSRGVERRCEAWI
jgi:hypothetical protein